MEEEDYKNGLKISRRSFLNTSLTAAAGLMILPHNFITDKTLRQHLSKRGYPNGHISSVATVLEKNFHSIPAPSKPWVYWWWLKGNVSKESITRELEEMNKQGIGGVLICDSRGYHDDYYTGNIPVPLHIKHEFMSSGWRNMLKHATQEAARLGMQVSVNLSNTGGSLRGPWDMGAHGPKRLIWAGATVKGTVNISAYLNRPKEYFWDIALLAVKTEPNSLNAEDPSHIDLNGKWYEVVNGEKGDAALAYKTIDLSDYIEQGFLNWDVPEGQWRILRFACAVFEEEGHHGGMSAGKGSVDILNEDAVEHYFNLMGNRLLDEIGSLAGNTLTHFYNVSWEGVYPNWTLGLEHAFEKYRRYDLKPFFPVLAGMIVKNIDVSKRFMRDFHRTLSDCFRDNCYKKIGKLSHARGVNWHSENGGPWKRDSPLFKEADMLNFWGTNDMPQAEFWCATPDRARAKTNARFAAMAAHTYGHKLVSIEAFTHMDYHWSKYPAYLKFFADMNFIDGANKFVWHTFTSSPKKIGKPGYEYFAGTHFNPNVTWWNDSGSFMNYLGRCQYLLSKGYYVADACVYVSDKNYVRWGRGKKWSNTPTITLGEGYKYDLINVEILLNRLWVENGKIVLPDGMSYQVLVVDLEEEIITVEALKKIYHLAKSGATIVLGQRRPKTVPGLDNYPEGEKKIHQLSKKLWPEKSKGPHRTSIGKGEIYTGTNVDKVFEDKGILPDFEGPFEYIHRKSENLDIYFISGTGEGECTFRIKDRKPELWDPVRGRVYETINYRYTNDGRTVVPINLPRDGSMFVVFRNSSEPVHVVSVDGPGNDFEIKNHRDDILKFLFWQSGNYRIKFSNNKTKKIKVETLPSMELTGPWKVEFTPGWGAPETIIFQRLIPWNAHSDQGIKYYSGTAVYKKMFSLKEKHLEIPVRLHLGEVHNIARVHLNDNDLGVVWTAPWIMDLSDALKEGENKLEIEVTNCWINRLIGDAALPPEKRFTETNVRLISERGNYRSFEAVAANDSLLPSGLVGPVQLKFGDKKKISY